MVAEEEAGMAEDTEEAMEVAIQEGEEALSGIETTARPASWATCLVTSENERSKTCSQRFGHLDQAA